ncbi:MAG: pyridoxamine 5'-phosphate oxidase family protein [Gallionella sp.]|nr:pyridoxamine 5'-phosphate oxidase family protein [Gallionella sp.]
MLHMITDNSKSQSNARTARQMLRAHRYGTLSTLSKKFDGHPFGSIAPYMVDHDGSLLILISGLAEHTKNILNDSRVSLITHDQNDPHIQTQGRVTLVGNASFDPERDRCGKRYLRYFPEAQTYFDMADFNFFRIVPFAIRHIGGFGDIHWVKADNYRVPIYPLIAGESELLAEFDSDQRKALARSLGIVNAQEVVMVGVDCDGFDLCVDDRIYRSNFTEVLLNAVQARAAILAQVSSN